ncbi:MAG: hypothetical protein WC364_12010 [Eubacteriales bacterium]|jgi:hypothetical protein
MNIKIETPDLMLIGMVINEAGLKKLEEKITDIRNSYDSINAITENPFENGKLVGRKNGVCDVLLLIKSIRTQLSEIEEKNKGD